MRTQITELQGQLTRLKPLKGDPPAASQSDLVTELKAQITELQSHLDRLKPPSSKKKPNPPKGNAKAKPKVTERAKVEATNLSNIQKEHNLDQETIQQWVCDVSHWAVTERVYAPGCTEDLRADIESITVTLLRKKQDLYRQHDSNQARQRKLKKMTELKKKLREKVLQYNTIVEEDHIDEELACSLTGLHPTMGETWRRFELNNEWSSGEDEEKESQDSSVQTSRSDQSDRATFYSSTSLMAVISVIMTLLTCALHFECNFNNCDNSVDDCLYNTWENNVGLHALN
ncbi:hypothetical protein ABVT39_019095 [Epinephelus coioides]